MREQLKVNPEEKASICNKAFFLWTFPIYNQLRSKGEALELSDLAPLPKDEDPELLVKKLKGIISNNTVDGVCQIDMGTAIWKLIQSDMKKAFFLINVAVFTYVMIPFCLATIVEVIDGTYPPHIGYIAAITWFVINFVGMTTGGNAWTMGIKAGRKALAAVSVVLFEKPVLLSSKARAQFTEGEVLNLMSMDGQTIIQFIMMTNIFSVIPVLLFVPLFFLCFVMGWPTLVGIGLMALNVFVCDFYGKKVETLQARKNTLSDERSSILNEIFQGIRTIKLNAWETSVAARVKAVRNKEINIIRQMNQYRALQTSLSWATPALAMMFSFLLYAEYISKLTPAFVFLALPLFTQANLALVVIPMLINEYRRYRESTKRMGAYLFVPNDYKKLNLGEGEGHVIVNDATFEWGVSLDKNAKKGQKKRGISDKNKIAKGNEVFSTKIEQGDSIVEIEFANLSSKQIDERGFVLKNISFEIKPKQLVAVVGRVASGKSTFGASILGLITKTTGDLIVEGKTAYVSQEAFIMNETVRENILFGEPFKKERYDNIVSACEMSSDMELFINQDMTQVGEKGITISGGQRQRIAIARAAYSQANIVVFDDPLSAMDAHVGKAVFDNCISNDSIMKDRTRIFITNQLQYCEECDYIYCLENGNIVEQGTYEELMNVAIDSGKHENDESKTECSFFRNLNAHQVGLSGASTANNDEATSPGGTDNVMKINKNTNITTDTNKLPSEYDNATNDDLNAQSSPDYDIDAIMIEELKGTGRVGMSELYRTAKRANTLLQFWLVVFFIATVPFLYWTMTLFLALWSESESDSSTLEGPMLYYIIMAVGYAVGVALLIITVNDFFLKNSERLHNEMLDAILECPMSWFDTTPVGRIMNRFNNDIMNFDISSPRNFEQLVEQFGRLWIGILPLCFLAPPLIIVAIPFTLICYFFFQIYAKISLIVHRLYLVANSPVLTAFSAWLQGLDTIRAYAKVGRFRSVFTVNHALLITAMNNSSAIDRLFIQFTPPMIINNCTVLVAMGLIFMKDMTFGGSNEKIIGPGLGGLILTGMVELCFRLPHYFWLHSTQERFMASGKRIVEYANLAPEKSSQKQNTEGSDSNNSSLNTQWPKRGTISFKNVTMRYRENLPLVLKSVSFVVRDGERVAIVGRTGAGKSSILLTLLRMMEIESGSVLVDGVDIKTIPGRILRSRFGMIPQDSFILQGTIRSNLDLEDKCSDDTIWKVLESVDLKALVENFEEKLDHRVDERGSNLSAGTVQLLCLARVLIDNPRVIIMDEATSSVDIETDALVQATIRKVFKGKTIISIAHRLQTIIDFDKVLVLNEGQVAEFDHPHVLLQNSDGVFTSLVEDTGQTSSNELFRRAKKAHDEKQ